LERLRLQRKYRWTKRERGPNVIESSFSYNDGTNQFWPPTSLSFNSIQIGKYQIAQIIAIAAFQNTEQGHAEGAELLAQPMIIFRFESFLGEWVTRISIKSGGDANQLGVEFFHLFQGAA